MPSQHDTDSLTGHPNVAAIRQERAKAERHERYAAHNRLRISVLLKELVGEGHTMRSIGRAIGRSKQRVSQLTVAAAPDVAEQRAHGPVGAPSSEAGGGR